MIDFIQHFVWLIIALVIGAVFWAFCILVAWLLVDRPDEPKPTVRTRFVIRDISPRNTHV